MVPGHFEIAGMLVGEGADVRGRAGLLTAAGSGQTPDGLADSKGHHAVGRMLRAVARRWEEHEALPFLGLEPGVVRMILDR
ncbi:hypothetical protein T484DRAFT_1816652 [Baffinella frigidus]|nr:hypothetical protein T484DRAFT_1816652 [Cryptophyta sp. CCMP2293]